MNSVVYFWGSYSMEELIAAKVAGVAKSSLIAGFLGSLISLQFLVDIDRMHRFFAVVTGTLSAYYITPFLISYFRVVSDGAASAFSFFIGMTSMSLFAGIFTLLKKWRKDPISFLSRFIGK